MVQSPRQCVQVRLLKIMVLLIEILASSSETPPKTNRMLNDLDEDSMDNDHSDDFMLDDEDISRTHNRTVLFSH